MDLKIETQNIYIFLRAANHGTITRLSKVNETIKCEQAKWRMAKPKKYKNTCEFTNSDIDDVSDGKCFYKDAMVYVQVIAGVVTLIVGIGVLLLLVCFICYREKCVTVTLKDGRKIDIIYNKEDQKNQVMEFLKS